MNDAKETLREVYDLLREYDIPTQLEDEARAYDAANPTLDALTGWTVPQEWLRVLAILEGMRVVIDAEHWDALPAVSAAADGVL